MIIMLEQIATVMENYLTFSHVVHGVVSMLSMQPTEMTQLMAETERAWQALGR